MTDKNYKKHLRIVHGEHPDDSGGFQLLDLIITELKSQMTC